MKTQPGDIVIETEQLSKDYLIGFLRKKAVRALDDLTIQVFRGEIFGFLGPNGAGKTTTLKLLMSLIYPTSGTARILGKPIDDVETRRQIGYLPENPYFYDYLSGRELLTYTASLFGYNGGLGGKRADEMLSIVGLDNDAAGRQLRKYSKGMLQRIGIAQALINDPEVAFFDEPMSGLDPIGRREVRDILLSLRQRGKTIFFSSHILSDIEALCDRAAIIERGRLVKCGTIEELRGGQHSTIEVIAIGLDKAEVDILIADKPSIKSVNATACGVEFVLDDESKVEDALAVIRQCGGRLVSVNANRTSLEDAFFNTGQGES